MTVTHTISRADLKARNYKQAKVQRSGTTPAKRSTDLLVAVLKKAVKN